MQLKDWIKKFPSEKEAIKYLTKETGFSERHIRRLIQGWKTDKLSTAIKVSKATGIPLENLLRPDVAEALKEYLLRCPTSKTSTPEEQLKSLKDKEG